ncbi:MAG: hypothetical protein BWY04_01025 [candidate division CPR1 bacterium ADurb.Bin160]|uniref:Uncharacterized protein n=1 Tax=candidate division CPR1 bacterium ADurb.Bin160 TaxID=1852826 RepID=A0A1V5ZLP8_9BACT|nr:MAG: hypothetical protein BWY04_01025 [candidate division CPR1 bacterium ADurb.Bin160]
MDSVRVFNISNENIDEKENTQKNKYNELIEEYNENRNSLKRMIRDIEELKEKLDKLFPETLDKRYLMFFEQKVKTAFSIYSTLLEIRKEISRSLKDEIEMRRKIDKDTREDDILESFNIHDFSEKIEKYKKEFTKNDRRISESE